jgi:hypothetical protein
MLFDSAFALSWKIFYVEERRLTLEGVDDFRNDLKEDDVKARW